MMKYLITCIILFLSIFRLSGQVITDKTVHDFGEVTKDDEKYVDFKLTNASKEVIHITRTEEPYGTSVKFSSKTLQPDSSVLVRIKYTPRRKGEFRGDVPIWVSSNSQPIILTIAGKALTFDPEESMEPPDFQRKSVNNDQSSELKITVVEKSTGMPIENAKIDLVWDGVIYRTLQSDQQGKASKALKKDSYYVIASAKGYAPAETGFNFEQGNTELVIELGQGEAVVVVQQTPSDSGQALQDEPVRIDTAAVAIETPPVVIDTVKPVIEVEEPVKEPEIVVTSKDLPEDRYSPNNIVFLIDVSVSMKLNGKLDLLKASMIELTNLLRSGDKVAIVTYSSKTTLALPSISASDKDKIIEVIKSLEANGNTSSTKGVKRAYSVLNKNKIHNGNNQVFISTDGAFNLDKGDKKLLKIVKRNSRKGNKISVLGIKNQTWTVKNMEEIAKQGQGNYLHIENYETAKSSLVEEVKKQSFRR